MPAKNSRVGAEQHERRLLARVAAGDKRAFEQLFFAYYQRALRFVLRMVRIESIAEEVVNDVMLVVWRKADTFAGQSLVSTWVFGIAYRKSLKALRRQRMLKLFVRHDAIQDLASSDGGYGLSEQNEWLASGFALLSVKQRAVVELSYFAGYNYAEIAQILRCPENTVKTRMFHARRKLKAALPGLAGDTDRSTRRRQ